MYHRILHIAVMGRDPILEKELLGLPPQERFEHEFRMEEEYSPEALAWADIAIIRTPLPISIGELRDQAKDDKRLICCMTADEEKHFHSRDIACLDDIWLRPLRPPRIRLHMNNILKEIKRSCDARMHLNWLDTLIDSVPDLIWFKDVKGSHLKVNKSFCEAVGKTKQQCEGRDHHYIWDLTPDEYAKGQYVCLESETETIKAGKTTLFDEKVKLKRGMRQFKTYKTPIYDTSGEVLGTVGFAHDITNLLNLDVELDLLINAMPVPILMSRDDGFISMVNRQFLEFFDEKKENVIGTTLKVWKTRMFVMKTTAGSEHKYASRNRTAPITPWARPLPDEEEAPLLDSEGNMEVKTDGEPRWIHLIEENVTDFFGNPVGKICVFRDVTEKKLLGQHLQQAANFDALTGLANRHSFSQYVRSNPKGNMHLFYVDLDNFKGINDTYGHEKGDEALLATARALRKVFKGSRDFPVRLGGDEFLISTIKNATQADLERLATDLQECLLQEIRAIKELDSLSFSIGILANCPRETPIDELIREADQEMYKAKKAGKAQYSLRNAAIRS